MEFAVVDLDLDLDHPAPPNLPDLAVYPFAIRFLPLAMRVSDGLPKLHAGLADQLRRASLSIGLNVAEDSGQTTCTDPRRFQAMARGSAMECTAILDAGTAYGWWKQIRRKKLTVP